MAQPSQPPAILHMPPQDSSIYSNAQIVGSHEQLDHYVGQYSGNGYGKIRSNIKIQQSSKNCIYGAKIA